ncbi:MAG: LLM class flavin-dependent oxidoreductase [Dehalococcoidia bacterium]|nr:LLM class flavin-dependent oxidoreductase [Dehalococcoidia bacterium]
MIHLGLGGWQRDALAGDPRALLRLVTRVDTLGFDSVWLQEQHFQRANLPYPSPLLLAAAIFAVTERLRVGLAVVVAPLHHPLRLAEDLAQLDAQSQGRLDVGLGRGARPDVYAALGVDLATARERLALTIRLLREAWTHDTISCDHPLSSFRDVAVGPRPVQFPHPPLFLAGYTPESITLALAEQLPLLLSLEPPEGRQLTIADSCARALGQCIDRRGWSLARYVCCAETRAQALSQAETLLEAITRRRVALAVGRGEPADRVVRPDFATFCATQAIVGDPDDCLRQLEALTRTVGVGHFRLVFNGNGALAWEHAETMMRCFAQHVLPIARQFTPPPPAERSSDDPSRAASGRPRERPRRTGASPSPAGTPRPRGRPG